LNARKGPGQQSLEHEGVSYHTLRTFSGRECGGGGMIARVWNGTFLYDCPISQMRQSREGARWVVNRAFSCQKGPADDVRRLRASLCRAGDPYGGCGWGWMGWWMGCECVVAVRILGLAFCVGFARARISARASVASVTQSSCIHADRPESCPST
jgi:hypothetical protein